MNRADSLNNTELRTILRNRGIVLDSLVDRGRLVDWATVEAEPDEGDRLALTLIDRWRGAIMLWSWKMWPELYFQISCPLGIEGCWGCSDFRVVSCLTNNDPVFDTADKEVSMANWGDILKTIANRPEDGSTVLEALAEEKLTGDPKSLSLALMRLAVEVGDIIEKGKARSLLEYVTMSVGETETPAAFKLVNGRDPKEVLLELAGLLKNFSPDEKPAEAPVAEKAKSELPKPLSGACFPGAMPADQSAGQDAAAFINGNGKPEEKPVEATKPPEAAPKEATKPPEAAPKEVTEPPKTAPKEVTELQEEAMSLLLVRIGEGLNLISRGFTLLSSAMIVASGRYPNAWDDLMKLVGDTDKRANSGKMYGIAGVGFNSTPAGPVPPNPPKQETSAQAAKPKKAMAFPDNDGTNSCSDPTIEPDDSPFDE